jgi:hypothetical protein
MQEGCMELVMDKNFLEKTCIFKNVAYICLSNFKKATIIFAVN